MKLVLKELFVIKESIGKLSKINSFNGVTTYKVAKMLKKLDEEIKPLEEARLKIYDKLGNKENGSIKVDEKNQKQLSEELNDLFNQEIELDIELVEIPPVDGLNATDYLNLEGKLIKIKE